MLEWVKEMIALYQKTYPWAQLLFVFDHSSNHTKVASDGLRTSKMNVHAGGTQGVLKTTRTPNGDEQHMTFKKGDRICTDGIMYNGTMYKTGKVTRTHQLLGVAKGLRQVVWERGFSVDKLCRQDLEEILDSHDDFKNQKTLLAELIESVCMPH